MSRYDVALDVFFIQHVEVEAESEEDAKRLAIDEVHHGMGEEVTVYEVEEIKS